MLDLQVVLRAMGILRRHNAGAGLLLAFGAIASACSTAAPTASPTATTAPTSEATFTAAVPTPTKLASTATPEPTAESETESVIQYVTAYAYLDRGDFVEAEKYFNTVVELEPGFARAWDGRGQARMFNGEVEEALLDFDRAISLKPNLAQAYAHRAFARVTTGDSAGAERDAEKSLALNADQLDAHIVLGRLLAESGRFDEALERFDRAVALAPLEGSVYWWRGRFFRDFAEDYERSKADFDRAVDHSPAQATIYIDRALLEIYAGRRFDVIRADLEEAISLAEEPRLPDVLDRAEYLLNLINEAEATGAPIIVP